MISIIKYIKQVSQEGYISLVSFYEIISKYNISFRDLEELCLHNDVIPLRYQRNFCTISRKQQLELFDSHIAIIGCGGIGGNLAEYLCRIGIGNITLMDYDIFEEHNLNRQNFSTLDTLGKLKVEIVKKGLEKINPACNIIALNEKFTSSCISLNAVSLIIDALDNPDTKKELYTLCKNKNISFVHGAIAGFNGQFLCDEGLDVVYNSLGKGCETMLGNPSFSASFAASVQASLVINKLLNKKDALDNMILISDLKNMEFNFIPKV